MSLFYGRVWQTRSPGKGVRAEKLSVLEGREGAGKAFDGERNLLVRPTSLLMHLNYILRGVKRRTSGPGDMPPKMIFRLRFPRG